MAVSLELIAPDWPAPTQVRAFATTRGAGVSQGVYASLNLGDHVGDEATAVAENRRRLLEYLELPEAPRWLHQVHGTNVVRAQDGVRVPAADAMWADARDQVCVVLTADCLPVLLCDTAGRRVAAAHAGWRGLAAGILQRTVQALCKSGVAACDLLAWLGPAISGPAYEVGSDVREAYAQDPHAAAGFCANARGRWQLDIAAIARSQLQSLGLDRVYGGSYCTYGDRERFFSHRRDGPCGRQATLIWLE
jgi:YfiH family protein